MTAAPMAGCTPLIDTEAKKKAADRKPGPPKAPLAIEDIQSATSRFLTEYRQFLDCCVSDPEYLEDANALEDRASFLLEAVQEKGLINRQTQWRGQTLQTIVPPVVKARNDLRQIQQRMKGIEQTAETLDGQGYETTGRIKQGIQREEESLRKDFRPTVPPTSARTGTDIEDTTIRNAYGEGIGAVVTPRITPSQSLRPRAGTSIDDSTMPNRYGSNIEGGNRPAASLRERVGADVEDTTRQPNVGFDIGTERGPFGRSSTPARAGPAIGDSSQNRDTLSPRSHGPTSPTPPPQ
ncbi:MAG: hypothetical protein E8D45_04630 [Nitrospira sp.]|nr:MAG: hypothetical protein E8D45_04630 [Nitrospira sp.]